MIRLCVYYEQVSSFTIPDGIIHDRLSIKSSNNDSTGVLEYLDKMKVSDYVIIYNM